LHYSVDNGIWLIQNHNIDNKQEAVMTRPMSYPQGELDRWLMDQVYDHTRQAYPQLNLPERPVSRPITKIHETTLDLGVCGEVPVNVMYEQTGTDVQIKTVSWRGVDLKNHLSELLLMDLQSDIRESLE
jgi:hypothetical protein